MSNDTPIDLASAEAMFELGSEGYVPGSIPEDALNKKIESQRVQTVLGMMENFPVLAGRCTKGHAQHIVDALDILAAQMPSPEKDTHQRIEKCRDEVTRELGYIAAEGAVIRAVKLHRSIFGSTLVDAKVIITEAAELARSQYTLNTDRYVNRIAELEEALRTTRRLVTDALVAEFSGESQETLFRNQAAICKVVPMRPQDRDNTKAIPTSNV